MSSVRRLAECHFRTRSLGLCVGLGRSPRRAIELYDRMIFGSQSKPKLLQYTHT